MEFQILSNFVPDGTFITFNLVRTYISHFLLTHWIVGLIFTNSSGNFRLYWEYLLHATVYKWTVPIYVYVSFGWTNFEHIQQFKVLWICEIALKIVRRLADCANTIVKNVDVDLQWILCLYEHCGESDAFGCFCDGTNIENLICSCSYDGWI